MAIKLNKEELKEYLNVHLDGCLKNFLWDCYYEKVSSNDLSECILDKMYSKIVMSIVYDEALLAAKRQEKFDKDALKEWIKGQDILTKYEKAKIDNGQQSSYAVEPTGLCHSLTDSDKEDVKKSVEEAIAENPEIKKEDAIKIAYKTLLEKSEREEYVSGLEFELKRSVGLMVSRIPEGGKDLFKNIYGAVESKMYSFPTLYMDAFAILEYMNRGGHFADPIQSIPVKFSEYKSGTIEHSQGDGDVSKQTV